MTLQRIQIASSDVIGRNCQSENTESKGDELHMESEWADMDGTEWAIR